MMSVEIKVNGALIGHLYLHNEATIDADLCRYVVEYAIIGEGKVMTGHLLHRRDDGAEVLVKKAFQWIVNKSKPVKE